MCWYGEGWYGIGWSDGGTYGEVRWYETYRELERDYDAAYGESSETHLPFVDFLGDGDEPE